MGFRSGATLVQLLREARDETKSDEVRQHIDAAIAFATSQPGSGGHRYQRGKQLVNHLEDAAETANQLREVGLGDRLTDFADYAAGRKPLSLLETWYIPGRRQSDDRFMRQLLEVGLGRCVELIATFIEDRPDASAQDVCQWLRQVTETMQRWSVGEDRLGGVKLRPSESDHLVWLSRIQLLLSDPTDKAGIRSEVAEEIADLPGSTLIAQVIRWRQRKAALQRLRTTVEDPSSTEHQIHALLRQQAWIFGGRYVKELERRRLTTADELDIPLVRGDGALHVIELKRAAVPNLVEPLRSHYAVGLDVHRAVSQAANYLRSLDENRAVILAEHGIECRRTFATVLIGHPKFITNTCRATDVASTIRTYNAALSRVEVMTYEELLDSAERILALDDDGT